MDTHTVADLLKKYLRDLPQPIIPVHRFYNSFLAGATIKDEKQLCSYLSSLIKALPEDNYELLKYLCKFFWCLAQYSAETKMGASNISIIFSPLFFGQSDSANSSHLLLEAKYTSYISKAMIDHFDSIFTRLNSNPACFMIAYESVSNSDFSLIKGEEVVVCYSEDNNCNMDAVEMCFVNINGRISFVPKLFIESKCKPQPKDIGPIFQGNANFTDASVVRGETIKRLLAIDDKVSLSSTNISASPNLIEVGGNDTSLDIRKLKPGKKNKGWRKSETIKHFINGKSSTSSSSQLSPNSARKRSGSCSNSDGATHKKEKKKEKPEKEKEKKKKINSTITAWYGAPTTRSTNSFFQFKI